MARTRWNRYSQRPDLFDHGGGGFGFLSDLWWAPQLGLGIAVLTNSEDHQLQGDLALSILGDLVSEQGPYRDRLLRLPERPQVVDGGSFEPPAGLSDMISKAAMAPDAEQAARWASYSGRYRAPVWGLLAPIGPTARFSVEGGVPYAAIPDDDGTLVRHRLTEIRPGLFLADNGETLDLRGPDPTWANLRIVRVTGPLWWQWVLLLATAGVALLWLVGAAVRAVRRRSARSAASCCTCRWPVPSWEWPPAPSSRWPGGGTGGLAASCCSTPASRWQRSPCPPSWAPGTSSGGA